MITWGILFIWWRWLEDEVGDLRLKPRLEAEYWGNLVTAGPDCSCSHFYQMLSFKSKFFLDCFHDFLSRESQYNYRHIMWECGIHEVGRGLEGFVGTMNCSRSQVVPWYFQCLEESMRVVCSTKISIRKK